MRVAAAALLLLLGGCATTARTARVPAPPSAPVARTDDAATDLTDDEALAAAQASLLVAAEQLDGPPEVEPEALRAARLELAREDLVENNLAKREVDVEEELERELAALQATSQTSKSRVRHATQAAKP